MEDFYVNPRYLNERVTRSITIKGFTFGQGNISEKITTSQNRNINVILSHNYKLRKTNRYEMIIHPTGIIIPFMNFDFIEESELEKTLEESHKSNVTVEDIQYKGKSFKISSELLGGYSHYIISHAHPDFLKLSRKLAGGKDLFLKTPQSNSFSTILCSK